MALGQLKPLGQLLKRPPRYGVNAAAVPHTPGVPTYIRITDIDRSGTFAPNPKVGVTHPNSADYKMAEGELVFARTGASVGKSYLYDPRDGELVYAGFLINIAPDPGKLSPMYLSLIVQTKQYWDWVARTSVRSGQPGINGREYAQFLVSLPDIATQNVIADAMTDVDGLLAALERLIAKKQAIKQGMMQQLLTGKTRLPGFTRPWLVGPFKHFMPLQRGFDLPTSQVRPGVYPVVYSNGVARSHAIAMVKGPGVITGRSGTIGKVHYVSTDYWPHNTALWITSFARTNAKFVYYFLSHLGLERFASGSGVPTFNRNDAHGFEVRMPPDVKEQEAIAQVLTDVDEELEVLLERLAKARGVKQGMIQQLLTGQTRLPVTEDMAA